MEITLPSVQRSGTPTASRMDRRPCSAPVCGTVLMMAALVASFSIAAVEPPAPEPLGRLFFTPERRAALERQRLFNIQESQAQLVEGANLTVNGVVQRSSGRRTIWINGTAQNDNSAATGVHVVTNKNDPGKTTVTTGEEAPASLKIGETINRATGETASGVGGGKIVVKRGASASDLPN